MAKVTQTTIGPTRTQTVVVLALASVLRLLVVWTVLAKYPAGWLFTRGIEMGLLAKSLVDGLGLASPFGPQTGPTAFIAPGYPLLVAAVFQLLGVDTVASAVCVMLAFVSDDAVLGDEPVGAAGDSPDCAGAGGTESMMSDQVT